MRESVIDYMKKMKRNPHEIVVKDMPTRYVVQNCGCLYEKLKRNPHEIVV